LLTKNGLKIFFTTNYEQGSTWQAENTEGTEGI